MSALTVSEAAAQRRQAGARCAPGRSRRAPGWPRTAARRAWVDGLATLRLPVVIALLLLVGLPLAALVFMGLRPAGFTAFADTAVFAAARNSLLSAGGSAFGATAIGTVLAVVLGRFEIPGEKLLRYLVLLPFLIPPFIGAMAWMAFLAPSGFINSQLSQLGVAPVSVFGGWGVVLLLTIHSYPTAFLIIALALQQVPGNLEEAARTAGASTWTVLTTVTFPLLRGGINAALLLTFVGNLSDFGIPALIGLPERYTTLTTLVYRYLASNTIDNPLPAVAAIGLVLLTLAIVAVLVLRVLQPREQLQSSAAALKFSIGKQRFYIAAAIWIWVIAVCLIPLAALASQAVLPAPGVPFTAENITLENFARAVSGKAAGTGIRNSLFLAGAAALCCLLLGTAIAVLLSRSRHRSNALIDVTVALPQALPGIVIAVAWLLVGPILGIFNTPWLILAAYVMAFTAIVVQQLRAPLASITHSLEEAAILAGSSQLRVVLGISARMVLPAAVTGAVVVFFTAVRELTISILLVAPGTQTLGVTIFNLQQAGDYNAAAALALVVAVTGIVGLTVAAAFAKRNPH
ncbi:iron ABC transporter permease [Leucobacter sp. OH2974_COT-288]|nr:iron ABC transporter permease [Leucobacter sp. OH2974_COT-288]